MLVTQISTQTDNYMHRKSVATKKRIIFNKMDLKLRNPKFNKFLQHNINKMPTLWNSEINKAILEQGKVAVVLWLYTFQFFKKQKLCKQN